MYFFLINVLPPDRVKDECISVSLQYQLYDVVNW